MKRSLMTTNLIVLTVTLCGCSFDWSAHSKHSVGVRGGIVAHNTHDYTRKLKDAHVSAAPIPEAIRPIVENPLALFKHIRDKRDTNAPPCCEPQDVTIKLKIKVR
jgi:hypothetical protein